MRSARYREPARTLSSADDGSRRVRARFACTHCHVPGRICMTPRALAPDSIALLLPLSCQAIAAASEPGAPCWAAIEPTWPDVRRPGEAAPWREGRGPGEGRGGGAGRIVRCGAGVLATAGEPVGSLMTVPARSGLFGSRPFMKGIFPLPTRPAGAGAL